MDYSNLDRASDAFDSRIGPGADLSWDGAEWKVVDAIVAEMAEQGCAETSDEVVAHIAASEVLREQYDRQLEHLGDLRWTVNDDAGESIWAPEDAKVSEQLAEYFAAHPDRAVEYLRILIEIQRLRALIAVRVRLHAAR